MRKLTSHIYSGKTLLSLFIILGFVVIPALAKPQAKAPHKTPKGTNTQITETSHTNEALVILSTVTIPEMVYTRDVLVKKGIKIRSVFPPSAFIVELPPYLKDDIESLSLVEKVSYTNVDSNLYQKYESSTHDAIRIFNEKLIKPEETPETSPEPFEDTVIYPEPMTEEEKRQKEAEYVQHWNLRKQQLLLEEQEKKKDWERGEGKLSPQASQESNAAFLSYANNTPPLGAGFFDTSLYMSGDIAVGVFFQPGTDGNWIPGAEIDTVFDEIVLALEQFIEDEPNAHITFTSVKEVDGSGVPNPLPPSSYYTYINVLRNIYQTHWAYTIIVYKGDGRASAGYFGPSTRLYSEDLRDGYVVRHETMHIFGAMDQYLGAGISPVIRRGYLSVVNANSLYNDGLGYFLGRGESAPDIMVTGGPIGIYSRGQIGWRDSDGDGILESLDTFPDTVILSKSGTNTLTYTGQAQDRPLISESFYGNVTLNTISKVKYRINDKTWLDADPVDGNFDAGLELFTFTTPSLPNGDYTIEVMATNSVGNSEFSYLKDEATITGSPVSNASPFVNFSVSPPLGSVATTFTLDASLSSDLEDPKEVLKVRWDFESDKIWDTSFSTNKIETVSYSSTGTKRVLLEVKDQNGQITELSKEVLVTPSLFPPSSLPPTAHFTVTPENEHGPDRTTFDVTLDASSSFDPEDPQSDLLFRWDFEDDGVWDTTYSKQLVVNHAYPLPQRLPTTTFATPGNARDLYVSGNYAYVVDMSSLQIIDITDPATPSLAVSVTTPGNSTGISVSGNYAYVADGDSGLQVIDISTPTAATLVGSADTPDNALGISVSGNYAYVADGDSGLQVIDITNPAVPVVVGNVGTSGYAWDVYVSGNYAYVADWGFFQIIDISNPTAPAIVGNMETPGTAQGIYVSGTYAYVAEGLSGLQIIDVSQPATPTIVGNYDTSGSAVGVYLSGNTAYVGDYFSGLHIIDVTDPTTPTLVESSDTTGRAYRVHVSDGYAYVADLEPGLQIIDITQPFTFEVAPASRHWRARLEVIDTSGQTAQATRDAWAVTYNHPPLIEGLTSVRHQETRYNLAGSYDTPGFAQDVYLSGNYAYVADWASGLQIVDVTNPTAPAIVGSVDTPDFAYDVFVSGNYAYVAGWNSGLQIIDVTDPSSPTVVGSLCCGGFGISVLGNYAYLASFMGLKIIDITNPTAPVLVGDVTTPGQSSGVHVLGNYAYVADGGSGLQIIDVTDPTAPNLVGTYNTPGWAYDVYVSGNYAYVADKFMGLQIIDISIPTTPNRVGVHDTPEAAYSVYILGNYAYVADGDSGLRIINVTNPTAPTLAWNYNTPGSARGVHAVWNYVYVADGNSGFQIRQRITQEFFDGITCVVSDPDGGTTWDGLLEYRWAFDNDQIWDTEFSPSNMVVEPPIGEYSLVCEVRDRFGATDRKRNNPPTLVPIGDQTVRIGDTLTLQIVGSDKVDNFLDYSVTNLPPTAQFLPPDPLRDYALFSWTPTREGNYEVTFTVMDDLRATASETISISSAYAIKEKPRPKEQ